VSVSTLVRDYVEAAIARHAVRHDLDPLLVTAIVTVESGFDPYAFRPEIHYRWLWDVRRGAPFRKLTDTEAGSIAPPADFQFLAGSRQQEWTAQRSSFGCMQLMGALARELGFMGPYLTMLTDIDINIDLGCRHLANLLRRADGDSDKAISAYNAGWGNWTSSDAVIYRTKVKAAWARETD
jgi:transglycosylase-like protein with SLT domain